MLLLAKHKEEYVTAVSSLSMNIINLSLSFIRFAEAF
jgi:hypothetical protein